MRHTRAHSHNCFLFLVLKKIISMGKQGIVYILMSLELYTIASSLLVYFETLKDSITPNNVNILKQR